MSVINTNIGNSGYYQLNGSSSGAANNQSSAVSLASSLLQPQDSNNASSYSAAYLLDLSPEAQKYLAANQQAQTTASLSGQQGFVLSTAQRQQVTEIIAKYKDEPFTQETYNKIQDELEQAGLSGRKLAMVEKATSFNATQMLINALTGKGSATADTDANGAQSQAKIDNFMKQVVSQWQMISTTANAPAEPPTEEADAGDTNGDAVQATGGASEG